MSIGAAALNEFVLIFQGIMTLIVRDPSSALIHSVRPDRVPGARGDGSQVPDGGTQELTMSTITETGPRICTE
jgi:hypothetical protein